MSKIHRLTGFSAFVASLLCFQTDQVEAKDNWISVSIQGFALEMPAPVEKSGTDADRVVTYSSQLGKQQIVLVVGPRETKTDATRAGRKQELDSFTTKMAEGNRRELKKATGGDGMTVTVDMKETDIFASNEFELYNDKIRLVWSSYVTDKNVFYVTVFNATATHPVVQHLIQSVKIAKPI